VIFLTILARIAAIIVSARKNVKLLLALRARWSGKSLIEGGSAADAHSSFNE